MLYTIKSTFTVNVCGMQTYMPWHADLCHGMQTHAMANITVTDTAIIIFSKLLRLGIKIIICWNSTDYYPNTKEIGLMRWKWIAIVYGETLVL
jgi:hypothetical protein